MAKLEKHDYLYPDVAVLVFCKAPIPGQVKTRLIASIGAKTAATIHMRLTQRTLAMVSTSYLCPVQLWCSPDIKHHFFHSCVDDYRTSLHLQQGADLGARMHTGFVQALQHYNQVLLIGCDCPSLTAKDLAQAIKALKNDYDVVLAPAQDGGYTLIGLSQPHPDLFSDIVWGSSEVLASTGNKITRLGLNYLELAKQWDVDTPADLARFYALAYGKPVATSYHR